jgi:predicted Zn-dependent protease
MDAATKELLMEALNAAKLAGASYADAAIARYRDNQVLTREQQIINVVDQDSMGAACVRSSMGPGVRGDAHADESGCGRGRA